MLIFMLAACNCDPEGAYSLQCDDRGQCPCLPNIVGKHCDSCEENKYNITAGCVGESPLDILTFPCFYGILMFL